MSLLLALASPAPTPTGAQLYRLPLDPRLPVSNDSHLTTARIYAVYRDISAFFNAIVTSSGVTTEKMPGISYLSDDLGLLKLTWLRVYSDLVAKYYKLNQGLGSPIQNMQGRIAQPSMETLQAFKTQFYFDYRMIAVSLNRMAETVDTLNGY